MENIDEIYNNYANLIKNYIFSITGNKELSEEIMQEGRNETTGETIKYKTLEVYLYSDEYKYMYLTGGYELESGKNVIFYNIAAKQLPKGVEFDNSGLKTSFMLDDNIEKIFIRDTKNNLKEIWNKNMEVPSEQEWKNCFLLT